MIDIPQIPGIYKIFFLSPDHFYIGSAINLRNRYRGHISALQRGVHKNAHLQNAYSKYGYDAFHFEIIECVLYKDDLLVREQHYIDHLKPSYNIHRIAQSSLGVTRSIATKEKISVAKKGTLPHNKGKKGPTSPNKGKPGTNLGRKFSPDWCENISKAKTGKKHSSELRAKLSAIKKGKPAPNKGKRFTPEGKARMLARKRATIEAKKRVLQPPLWDGPLTL